ncbi:AEC family transporter [Marinomonas piezotolerans]|uniref:AEC family transporter n=1 Tax=Marinomonas piezotolerans TaxID=2213058 RepID=A0A370U7Y5_9GAMM|nr:AEC family transporter [Marinomonas piezotolerans]RDL43884.1 AEC family transporter [Marinomonas piezotolerans]
MDSFLSVVEFSISITAPIFLIIVVGAFLQKIGMINDNFVEVASKLVFNVTMPALIFISITEHSRDPSSHISLMLFGMLATFLAYIVLELLALKLIPVKADRGIVVQGAFRSNMAIVGLAYCINAYGDAALAVASIYIGGVMVLYNVLSVITINRSMGANKSISSSLKPILKNPLIIAIVLALLATKINLTLPDMVTQAGNYFARMTLPLALLCAGASLRFKELKKDFSPALLATIGKLIVMPVTLTLSGYWIGFRDIELGILFLLSSSPSASAGYIMARAMNGNAVLAANIIVLTTLLSLITTSLGVTILSALKVM